MEVSKFLNIQFKGQVKAVPDFFVRMGMTMEEAYRVQGIN
jgi:hypothetical protein